MADVKIQDVNLIATPAGSNKVPVSDGSGLAKTISVSQIIGVHEAKTDPHTQYAETSELGTAAYEDTTAFDLAGTASSLVSGLSSVYEPKNTNIQEHISSTSDPHNTQFDQLGGTLTKLPLNTSLAAQTLTAGEMAWNPDERCFDMGVNGVTLQAGQEQIVNVRNSTASQIANGTVCMATGTIGASGRITIAPMDGTNPANAMYLLGIATEDIEAGGGGFVTVFGKVRHLDTSAYEDGDVLYTSTTTPGALTKTAPTSGLKQPIAFVVHAASNGVIFVRIETINHLAFQANGIIVTDGDGTSYLANDGTYKTVSSGTTDHGSLSGLSDDDHTQYLNETRHDLLDHTGLTGIPAAYTLPTASTTTLGGVKVDGTTVTITDGVISSTATGGVTDHGALTGLADDDHTQYLNETRHDLLDHTGLTGIPSITGLLDETAHDMLDHTGLTGIPTQYTDEMAQDAIGTLITNGTQSGITVSYDDSNNKLDFTVTASGSGDVTGPSSATDGNIVLFDGITGKVIKDSAYNPSSFAAALGADDNYVTDAEKTKIGNLPDNTIVSLSGKEDFHGVESYGTIAFNNGTQTLSVASITYWYKGSKYTSATPITAQITSPVADRLYFFYFTDLSGVVTVSTTPWALKEHILLATVNWNGSVGAVVRETHNHTRDLDWHYNAHNTIGARYQSGLALVYPSTSVDNQISISGGTIWDEDIRTDIDAETEARLWYKTATSYTFDSTPTTLPYKWNAGTSRVQYLDTDTNTLTDLATDQYTVVWAYATPDIDVPIWILVGEHAAPYGTVAAARAATPPSLGTSPVTPETKLLYRWIFQGNGEFIESSDYRQASSMPAGGTASTSAASVTFTPSGNIASSNVQGAIEELDSEKISSSGVTYENLNANGDVGTGSDQVAVGNHTHAGVYEPADATILKDADIGVTVQAYDADLTSWAAIAPSAKQDTLISGTNIKTINSTSILGEGNIVIEGGSGMTNPMTTAGDIIYGGTDGAPTRLAKGTDGQVLTLASGVPAWTSRDIDWANPISVTGATTLTIGRHHVCSGTTADYTVILPAVSGNAGKLISIEMSGALTKLVTVDGNGSEVIDGATTRIMWARETAVLLCDGTQWTKVGGKSVPMAGEISLISANQLFNAATLTKINCNTFSGTAFLNDIGNNRIKSPRSTVFSIVGKCAYNSTNSTAGTSNAHIYVGGAAVAATFAYRAASTATQATTSLNSAVSQDTTVELYGYFVGGSFTTSTIYPSSTAFTALSVLEVPQW